MVENLARMWLSRILSDPDRLRQEIDLYQTKTEWENAPVLDQLKITDLLIEENQEKLDN